MIKVIQQRSRWEQGKLEKQGLRLARSVPSIHTVTGIVESKGESRVSDFPPQFMQHVGILNLQRHVLSRDNWQTGRRRQTECALPKKKM